MRSFLEDARAKSGNLTNLERSWVEIIKDKSLEVEDVIDEYLYYKTKQRSRGKLLHQTVCLPKNLLEKRRIAIMLQKIKTDIRNVREITQRYGMDRIQGSTSGISDDNVWLQNRAESSLFFKDEDLVGIDNDREKILRWMVDGEPHREVISVVGMGGSGKTTLIASAYRSQTVKRRFDCYAWITVSQKYTINELLKRMIKEFFSAVKEATPVNLGNMDYMELVNLLVNFLGEKRYVVVLDDVWSINLWEDINVSLPDNNCGSRVLITTRQEDIAASSFGVRSRLYNVKPLEMNESMTLFCKKAFSRNHDNSCPPELLILAQTLVEKCRGLPLAIVSLGGAMSSKKLESEWRRVNDSLDFELKNNPALDRMKCILLLSYHSLPYHLKRCFLYCCLFPEDYEIKRERLIALWMAEGFVEKERALTPEEVADNYLTELIHRNTLQDVRRYSTGPTSLRYKMHDLIREVGLSISRVENFCDIYYGQELASDNNGKTRLLSIQTNNQKGLESWMTAMMRLRSILIFASGKISPLLINITSSPCCKLLRVLDFENMEIEDLPSEVGDLFNLRYLNLKGTRVKKLPKSIGRLRNLQTLDLSYTQIQVLPVGISKLENLRHLISYNSVSWENLLNGGFHTCYVPQTPSTVYKLQHLQVLNGVEAEAEFMKHVRKMTQLTRLVITKVRTTNEEDLCMAIQNMNLLRRLLLVAIDEEEYLPTMDAVSSAPSRLDNLALYGKLAKVPRWFPTLESLTRLSLEWCRLSEDPLPYIQHLPNLVWLLLNKAFIENKLYFCEGFQKLIDLSFINFSQLEEMKIEKGVMSSLKNLCLWKLTKLKMLPHGIEHLSNLEYLNLAEVSNELVERIRGEESVDRYKVRHIPQIKHQYQSPSGSKWCYESLS